MTTATNDTSNTGNKPITTPDDWVEAHGDYLFNFAIGQVRDASVAEAPVPDPSLTAFKAPERFAGPSSERTWLVGIPRPKLYDHLRHTCRGRAVRADFPATHGDDEAWEDAVMW